MIASLLWLLMFQLYVFTSGRDSYSLCSVPFLHAVVRWKGLVEMEICWFQLHFCDKTLPFSKTEFRLKIPRGLSLRLTRILVQARVNKSSIYICEYGSDVWNALQVMSNDGLKLLYVQLCRHLSTQLTTLVEKQISKSVCCYVWFKQV